MLGFRCSWFDDWSEQSCVSEKYSCKSKQKNKYRWRCEWWKEWWKAYVVPTKRFLFHFLLFFFFVNFWNEFHDVSSELTISTIVSCLCTVSTTHIGAVSILNGFCSFCSCVLNMNIIGVECCSLFDAHCQLFHSMSSHSHNTVSYTIHMYIKSCSMAKNNRDFIGNTMMHKKTTAAANLSFILHNVMHAMHRLKKKNRVKCSCFMIKIFGHLSARALLESDAFASRRIRHGWKIENGIMPFSAQINCLKYYFKLIKYTLKIFPLNWHWTKHKFYHLLIHDLHSSSKLFSRFHWNLKRTHFQLEFYWNDFINKIITAIVPLPLVKSYKWTRQNKTQKQPTHQRQRNQNIKIDFDWLTLKRQLIELLQTSSFTV